VFPLRSRGRPRRQPAPRRSTPRWRATRCRRFRLLNDPGGQDRLTFELATSGKSAAYLHHHPY
jgi:hypothetical protein